MDKKVVLKEGKEKALVQRHRWIFSGAVETLPTFADGEILPVYDSRNTLLGEGYFINNSSLLGHMLAFGKEKAYDAIEKNLSKALLLKKQILPPHTNAYRLINAEGDGIPGLIIDIYDSVAIIQAGNAGTQNLKDFIVEKLRALLPLTSIYEKSSSLSERENGKKVQLLFGKECSDVEICENGLKFSVDIIKGQKSGFFLDQREMRSLIERFASLKKVLNCFAYTGAFSLFALRGGATSVVSIESSPLCSEQITKNLMLNQLCSDKHQNVCADVFDFVQKEPLDYDLIILDPPAFAKKFGDVENALKGYRDLNRMTMQKMKKGTFLMSSSCSAYVDAAAFQKTLFQAALSAKRNVRILQEHRMSFDHPISLYNPEGKYLKSFFLYVD